MKINVKDPVQCQVNGAWIKGFVTFVDRHEIAVKEEFTGNVHVVPPGAVRRWKILSEDKLAKFGQDELEKVEKDLSCFDSVFKELKCTFTVIHRSTSQVIISFDEHPFQLELCKTVTESIVGRMEVPAWRLIEWVQMPEDRYFPEDISDSEIGVYQSTECAFKMAVKKIVERKIDQLNFLLK